METCFEASNFEYFHYYFFIVGDSYYQKFIEIQRKLPEWML